MRAISLALGFALIAVVGFVPAEPGLAHGQQESSQAPSTTVLIGDFWFCDSSFLGGVCETTIDVGDTVAWDYASGGGTAPHTTTECGDPCKIETAMDGNRLWDSGQTSATWMLPGDTFAYTFNTPGTFFYLCAIHPDSMRGAITVQGQASTPTPTPTPVPTQTCTPTPTPTTAGSSPTPTATPTAVALGVTSPPDELPTAGSAPPAEEAGIFQWWHLVMGGASLLLIASINLALLKRRSSE